MSRGFYSLIQYCPDRARAEMVNVGLIILNEETQAIDVKLTKNYDRVCRLFNIDATDLEILKFEAISLVGQMIIRSNDLRTFDELTQFIRSRANDFHLTDLRSVRLSEDVTFESMFARLVDTQKSDFIKHLDKCSETVKTWPEWKRNALKGKG